MRIFLILLSIATLTISCSTREYKNVSYLETDTISTSQVKNIEAPTLNIFQPKNVEDKTPIIIFVHGGNWRSGKKETYEWLGRNFAKKGVLAIIPGYTLSPKATYDDMTMQIAQAIKWTKENATTYGGDPEQLFVTGHSAGGHLVALAVLNPKYKIDQNDISGIILNDAAGLDIAHYLQKYPPQEKKTFTTTWSENPEIWRDASPINFINDQTPPILTYLGAKTFPYITEANERFQAELQKFQPDASLITLETNHAAMLTQYISGDSKRYTEIIDFMKSQ